MLRLGLLTGVLISALTMIGCAESGRPSDGAPAAATASPPTAAATAAPAKTLALAPSAAVPAPPAKPLASIEVPGPGGGRRPLLVLLHGLGASGELLLNVAPFRALARDHRYAIVAPEGATDKQGRQYWNAFPSCCNFDGAAVDHVAELSRLIDSARENPAVDPSRVFVIGYSNGGFMAHRLACELSSVAGIVSIAGAGPGEGDRCPAKSPVAVLQIHGDADKTIAYGGGHPLGRADLPVHPSAMATIEGWAARDRCAGKSPKTGFIDLEDKLDGAETTVLRYKGCARPVELWTVQGGGHLIAARRRGLDAIADFIDRTHRP